MEKSKAAVFVGMEKPLEVREFEVAPVTADTALVRMQMAAVCGSDVHYWHLPTTPAPAIMGHENVGVLAALGKNVTKDVLGQPLKEGDRVLFKRSNCGRCPGCVLGENCKVNPPYGLRPKFEPPYLKGGFSQYVYLDPNPWLLKVPEDLSTERALISNIGNHTLLRGIEKIGGVALADTVVVQGSGPIGMGAIIQTSIAGAGRIILVGAPANRLELGVEMGAGLTIDLADYPTPEARVARVQELTGGQGADMVIECSGGRTAVQEGAGHGAQRRQVPGHRADRAGGAAAAGPQHHRAQSAAGGGGGRRRRIQQHHPLAEGDAPSGQSAGGEAHHPRLLAGAGERGLRGARADGGDDPGGETERVGAGVSSSTSCSSRGTPPETPAKGAAPARLLLQKRGLSDGSHHPPGPLPFRKGGV